MFTFLLVVVSLWIFYYVRSSLKKRKIQNAPSFLAATAPQGLVEIQGFAWPKENVYFFGGSLPTVNYRIYCVVNDARSLTDSICYINESPPFYVMDPTGLVEVDPSNSSDLGNELGFGKPTMLRMIPFYSLPIADQQRITKITRGKIPGNHRQVQICEWGIPAGSPIYVQGDFRSFSTPNSVKDARMSEFAKRVFDFEARSVKNVDRILDKDSDGSVSKEEALSGYTGLAKRIFSDSNAAADFEILVHGRMRASKNHELLIVDTHQKYIKNSIFRSGIRTVTAAIIILFISFVFLFFLNEKLFVAAMDAFLEDRLPASLLKK